MYDIEQCKVLIQHCRIFDKTVLLNMSSPYNSTLPGRFSIGLRQLVADMLHPDPKCRPNAEKVLKETKMENRQENGVHTIPSEVWSRVVLCLGRFSVKYRRVLNAVLNTVLHTLLNTVVHTVLYKLFFVSTAYC